MSTPSPEGAGGNEYRPDIDGLRALSIVLVAVYHAFPTLLPSGFIGVDIFFVISGFLISGIIFKSLQRGTFSYVDFYVRRVKRIFPALALVLVSCLIVGYMLLLPVEWEQVGKHVGAGALFVSNLASMKEGDYFTSATPKPLLHLWSLGIEEQFYILWPLLLAYTWRWRHRLSWVLTIGFLVSLSVCLAATPVDRQVAYFFPATRFWELLIGAILAFLSAPSTRTIATPASAFSRAEEWLRCLLRKPYLRNPLAWTGIVLLFLACLLIREDRGFPGAWAFLPTLAAACLIAAGPQTAVNRIVLSARPLVFIGLISYPLYLWHWPLLVFPQIIVPNSFTASMRLLALAAAVLLAWISFRLVETPLRHHSSKWVPAVLTGVVFVLGGLGICIRAFHVECRLSDISRLVAVQQTSNSPTFLQHDNWKKSGDFQLNVIPGKVSPAVILIGDSHVDHYYERIMLVRARAAAAFPRTILATYAGCPPLPGIRRSETEYACAEFLSYALRQAEAPGVETVVFGAYWEAYFEHAPISEDDRNVKAVALHRAKDLFSPPLQVSTPEFRSVVDERRASSILRHLAWEFTDLLPLSFGWEEVC